LLAFKSVASEFGGIWVPINLGEVIENKNEKMSRKKRLGTTNLIISEGAGNPDLMSRTLEKRRSPELA